MAKKTTKVIKDLSSTKNAANVKGGVMRRD